MNGLAIIVIGVIVILLGWTIWRKQTWVTVYRGIELTEQASDQFALLQEKGIRCRIRNKPLRSHHNSGFGDHSSSILDVVTTIEVHKQDIAKAKELLEQNTSGQYVFQL